MPDSLSLKFPFLADLSTKKALEMEVTTPRFVHVERRRPPSGGIVGHLRIKLASEVALGKLDDPPNRMRRQQILNLWCAGESGFANRGPRRSCDPGFYS